MTGHAVDHRFGAAETRRDLVVAGLAPNTYARISRTRRRAQTV